MVSTFNVVVGLALAAALYWLIDWLPTTGLWRRIAERNTREEPAPQAAPATQPAAPGALWKGLLAAGACAALFVFLVWIQGRL